MYDADQLLALDRAHLWHPYSSVPSTAPLFPVVSAKGVRLQLADGRELIDGMASWWSAIHGYGHPALDAAIRRQLDATPHVMFGGLTHPAAVKLGQLLVELTPGPLSQVFLADSGSVSVEVALKMAIQYWQSRGQNNKHRFLALRGGYHGDTFGAMAVCDPVTGMHHLFSGLLPQHFFAERPRVRFDEEWDPSDLDSVRTLLEQHSGEIAAVIVEPIVQGAGGMWFYHPQYLSELRELCNAHQVLLIFDEIATGFGRTGELFACHHANVVPDILCLGKALTGGTMTLAATLCSHQLAEQICAGEAGAFMHGPTFMGNPLACAAAVASIELLISQPWKRNIQRLQQQLQKGLEPARELSGVTDVRTLGAIGVIELEQPVDMDQFQPALVEAGVWVRPFGRLVYVMPPYVINDADLATLCAAMVKVVEQQAGKAKAVERRKSDA